MLPVDRHAVRGDDRQSVVEYGPGQAVVLDEIPVAWADGDIAETLAVDGDNFAAPDTERAAPSAGAHQVDVVDLLGETVVGSALGEFARFVHPTKGIPPHVETGVAVIALHMGGIR